MNIKETIRKANLSKDLPMINSWLEEWNMPILPEWCYPSDVFIIPNVACAAYYKTNSKIAYIEQIVSNKHADRTIAKNGIIMIANHIFDLARQDGFYLCLGWSRNDNIIDLAKSQSLDITTKNFAAVIKDLRN